MGLGVGVGVAVPLDLVQLLSYQPSGLVGQNVMAGLYTGLAAGRW